MTILQPTEILEKIAQELDITDTQKDNITRAYTAVGEWLNRDGSNIKKFGPRVYPQGSVSLGTVVKPIGRDDCDVDMVCHLAGLVSSSCDPEYVKNAVGDEIKANETYKKMLQPEGKRCWTLEYSYAANFHMDILPSVSNEDNLYYENTAMEFVIDPIKATNKDKKTSIYTYTDTNPKGYRKWFLQKTLSTTILSERQRIMASLEKVALYRQKKSPLQVAIQLLKRHRDVMFNGKDEKPISIILTTLAALSYNGGTDLGSILPEILNSMPIFIQYDSNKGYNLPNPTCMKENFCDKWNSHPEKVKAFFEWLKKAKCDFSYFINPGKGHVELIKALQAAFDTRSVDPVFDNEVQGANTEMKNQNLGIDKMNKGNLLVGGVATPMLVHHNYGDNKY